MMRTVQLLRHDAYNCTITSAWRVQLYNYGSNQGCWWPIRFENFDIVMMMMMMMMMIIIIIITIILPILTLVFACWRAGSHLVPLSLTPRHSYLSCPSLVHSGAHSLQKEHMPFYAMFKNNNEADDNNEIYRLWHHALIVHLKWSGPCFLKIPQLFKCISGDKILFAVSSKGKFASYFNFYSLYNFWKDQLYGMSRLEFDVWLFRSHLKFFRIFGKQAPGMAENSTGKRKNSMYIPFIKLWPLCS